MSRLFKSPPAINGTVIPPKRFTLWAALYFGVFICLPVIGAGALLDLVLYTIFRDGFDSCYAVMCLFE